MKIRHLTGFVFLFTSSVAYANCPPPMQILFSCTLEESQARVEFCHQILQAETERSSSVTGDLKSYSLARGIERAELYFEPTSSFFNLIPANDIDRKIYGSGVRSFLMTGYENKDVVYAALLAVGEEFYSGFSGAEIRVFKNSDAMQNAEKGGEIARFFCQEGSVIADQGEFRP